MDSFEMYKKINHVLLQEENPSEYLNQIKEELKNSPSPLNFIGKLEEIKQEPKYHPEGDVFDHTMLVLDLAAKNKKHSQDERVFMWGALLHDIGKLRTTRVRKGRITSYDHDKVGEEMAQEFLTFFNEEKEFIDKVKAMVRWHMQPLFVIKNLPFKDIEEMKNDIDPKEIYWFSLCDRLGRGGLTEEKIREVENQLELFLQYTMR